MVADTATLVAVDGIIFFLLFWGFDKIFDFLHWHSKGKNELGYQLIKLILGVAAFALAVYLALSI